MIPGETSEIILKYTFLGLEETATEEQMLEFSEKYDLNDPLYIQYLNWVKEGLLHGDIGTSYVYNKSVLHLLKVRLPATIQLATASMLIALVLGVSLGVYSALKQNSLSDHLLRSASLFGVSMPGFWIGLILILIFSVKLKAIPATDYGGLVNLILPAFALSLHSVASVMRITRTSMLETLGQDYIKFAVSKGLPTRTIIMRHAMKNALLPVVTVLGFQMGHMLGGSIVIEQVFTWPGIGSLLVNSIFARDLPVVQGCVICIVTMFLMINFLVDISYTYLDTRIKYN
jgi:peptide/nickel transport system permease protein